MTNVQNAKPQACKCSPCTCRDCACGKTAERCAPSCGCRKK